MTRLTTPKPWVFSRKTKMESGEHHIDALDIDGAPVRLCTIHVPPGTRPLTAAGVNAEQGDDK